MKKLLAILLLAAPVYAVLPESAIMSDRPERVLTLEELANQKPPEIPKIWNFYAIPGYIFDGNLNHLLINAPNNSNYRLPDEALYTAAGGSLTPDWGRRWYPNLSYNFERYDYQNHTDFSYYSHNIYGSLHYWMIPHWGLDVSGDTTWFADKSGLVSRTHNVYGALRWAHTPWHARVGYSYHIENYVFSTPSDANANVFFGELSRNMWNRHSWFTDYWYRKSLANDPTFSFVMHYVEYGWVTNWTWRFRTLFLGSWQYKPYIGLDGRFNNAERTDRTYTFTFRPSFAIYAPVRLTGIYTYQVNHSTIDAKRYYDSIYTILLEVRF